MDLGSTLPIRNIMPTYEFECNTCGWHGLLKRPMSHCGEGYCPDCKEAVERTFTILSLPNAQSPKIDNHDFNHGLGVYDKGLGEVVCSRKHRREIMKRKGLHEVSKYDKDEFTKDPTITPPTYKEKVDQFDEAVNMVKTGEWKKGLTGRQVQEVENARSATKRGRSGGSSEKKEDTGAKVESRNPQRN